MRLLLVIPARIGSSRLPEKPLQRLGGAPLIQHTIRQARGYDFGAHIVVATDDERVVHAVSGLDVEAVLTDPRHASGTERVAEVAARPAFAGTKIIVNLQVDEPFLPGGAVAEAVRRVADGDQVATVAGPLGREATVDPARVKVGVDRRGRARWFSRSVAGAETDTGERVLQHAGCYVYTPESLAAWVRLAPVPEERRERLEQLRPLAHGMTIGVAELDVPPPPAIDTARDLREAEAHYLAPSYG